MNDYEWLLHDQLRRDELTKDATKQKRLREAKRFRKLIRRRK